QPGADLVPVHRRQVPVEHDHVVGGELGLLQPDRAMCATSTAIPRSRRPSATAPATTSLSSTTSTRTRSWCPLSHNARVTRCRTPLIRALLPPARPPGRGVLLAGLVTSV